MPDQAANQGETPRERKAPFHEGEATARLHTSETSEKIYGHI